MDKSICRRGSVPSEAGCQMDDPQNECIHSKHLSEIVEVQRGSLLQTSGGGNVGWIDTSNIQDAVVRYSSTVQNRILERFTFS